MIWLKTHLKALLLLGGALFMLIEPELVGKSVFTSHDWINVAIQGQALVVVFVGANTTATIGKYAKEISTFLAACLIALNNVVDGGVTTQEFWQIIVAGGIAIGVFLAPTAPQAVLPGAGRMGDSVRRL